MVRGENKIQACDASLLGQAGAQHSLSPLIAGYGAVMIRAYSRSIPRVCAKVNLARGLSRARAQVRAALRARRFVNCDT
jgi:hypothetical protein